MQNVDQRREIYRQMNLNRRVVKVFLRLDEKMRKAMAIMDEEAAKGEKQDTSRHVSSILTFATCSQIQASIQLRETKRRYAWVEKDWRETFAHEKTRDKVGAAGESLVK